MNKSPEYYTIRDAIIAEGANMNSVSHAIWRTANRPKVREAIELSLLHWQKNKWDPTTKRWSQGNFDSTCVLCSWAQETGGCTICPLNTLWGHSCDSSTAWQITHQGNKKQMVASLEKLANEYTHRDLRRAKIREAVRLSEIHGFERYDGQFWGRQSEGMLSLIVKISAR